MNGPPDPPPPADTGDDSRLVARIVARTALLALSVVLLFPTAFAWIAGGAWTRWVLDMGTWRWAAWGACFVAMTLMRFADGPKRK